MTFESRVALAPGTAGPPGALLLNGSRSRVTVDAVTQTLRDVQSRLRRVLPAIDGPGERQLRCAMDDIDELIRAVRGIDLFSANRLETGENALIGRPEYAEDPAGHFRGHEAVDIRCLFEQARRLRGRLHRLTVALALTEEFAADALEDLATGAGTHAETHRTWARRAREGAQTCRELDARVGDLPPLSGILGA